MFEKGMKVQCVDGTFKASTLRSGLHVPLAGWVYTVRNVEIDDEGEGLHLNEIFNPPVKVIGPYFGKEPVFRASRFIIHRPLQFITHRARP